MTKKHYNHPEVLVARIALNSMVLAGSPAPAPAEDTFDLIDQPGEQW